MHRFSSLLRLICDLIILCVFRNQAQDLQAEDRAYRIGQTKDVHIYRLISAKSLEENIYSRQGVLQLCRFLFVQLNDNERVTMSRRRRRRMTRRMTMIVSLSAFVAHFVHSASFSCSCLLWWPFLVLGFFLLIFAVLFILFPSVQTAVVESEH